MSESTADPGRAIAAAIHRPRRRATPAAASHEATACVECPSQRRRAAALALLVLAVAPQAWGQGQGQARTAPNGRALRAVERFAVPELGLRVAREIDPLPWEKELQPAPHPSLSPTLVLHSPPQVYPTTALTAQSLRAERLKEAELRDFAQGLVDSLAPRMGAGRGPFTLEAAQWGGLAGWQTRLRGRQAGRAFEALMFVGQSPGRWPILLQAQTEPGKLDHASEFIRRAWSNVSYL